MGVKDDKKEKEEKHLEDEFFERVINLLTSMFTMQAMAQVMTQVLTQITISTGIVSSSIMLPIDVQGTTIMLPLDIQGTTIMLPVDIQGQVKTLDINITGQVGNVKIEIAEVAEDVVINVQNTAETAIYIQTAPGTNVTIEVAAQKVDIRLTGVFQAYLGKEKVIPGDGWLYPASWVNMPQLVSYTVPEGKRLVILSISVRLELYGYSGTDEVGNRYPTAGWWPLIYTTGDDAEIYVCRGDSALATIEVTAKNPELYKEFPVPLILTEGQVLNVRGITKNAHTYASVEVYAVEEDID